MHVCGSSAQTHHHDAASSPGESVQCMAINASGSIMAVLTQLRLHFWSAGRHTAHLTTLRVPGASLDEDPAVSVLWRMTQGTHLVVVTTRRVLFFEADIIIDNESFMAPVKQPLTAPALRYTDAASRVCYSHEIDIDTGLAISGSAAGPYAFLICTTAGVVYIVGWLEQRILYQWTTVGLRSAGHHFSHVLFEPEKVKAGPRATSATPAGEVEGNSSTSGISPPANGPSQRVPRTDPLQLRHLDPVRENSFTHTTAFSSSAMKPISNLAEGRGAFGRSIRPPGAAFKVASSSLSQTPLFAPPPPSSDQRSEKESVTSVISPMPILKDDAGAERNTVSPSAVEIVETSSNRGNDFSLRRSSAGGAMMTGTILHVSFVTRLKLLTFIFSSGLVALCRTSCGAKLTQADVQLSGNLTRIVSASMCAFNARHYLLAVCTQAGTLSCRLVDASSLAVSSKPLWTGLRGLAEAKRENFGLVSALEWSPSEELLCVGFVKHGVVVLHYSGAVLLSHLPGPMGTPTPSAASLPLSRAEVSGGCSAVTWDPSGGRLWMAQQQGMNFFSLDMMRCLTVPTVGPMAGAHTPFALLSSDGLFLTSISEAAGLQGARELVRAPEHYLRSSYPVTHGAISCDGRYVACAGRYSIATFCRDSYSWAVEASLKERHRFTCVADPVWLRSSLLVVPALLNDARSFELLVFSNHSTSLSQVLCRVALDGRPTQLAAIHQDLRGDGYLVLYDTNQMLHLYRYDIFCDTADLHTKLFASITPIRTMSLTGNLAYPLRVIPVCLDGAQRDSTAEAPPRRSCVRDDGSEVRLLLHRRTDHALTWVRGEPVVETGSSSQNQNNYIMGVCDPLERGVPPPFVFDFWVDRSTPLNGVVLVTHEEGDGLVLLHLWRPSRDNREPAETMPLLRRMTVSPTRDAEFLPLCVSTFDGCVLSADMDCSQRLFDHSGYGGTALPFLTTRPILYAHRILSLLLLHAMPSNLSTDTAASTNGSSRHLKSLGKLSEGLPDGASQSVSFAWDHQLFWWLEQMRTNDTFVAVLDYFLHTALNDSPPAAVSGLSRRKVVQAVISLLRNYPEFYTIVVGCVRKIDASRWHIVLDLLGSPLDLYTECMAHRRYAEAMHLVRVIMMGSFSPLTSSTPASCVSDTPQRDAKGLQLPEPINEWSLGPLHQATTCAVELFIVSVQNGDYNGAYDLLRFMALLGHEIGMPTARSTEDEEARYGFVERWLRHLTWAEKEKNEDDGVNPTGVDKSMTHAEPGPVVKEHPALVFDRAGASNAAPEVAKEYEQQQSAVTLMFRSNLKLPEVVEQEALRLFQNGYVVQLARLLDTFSLSLPGFLKVVGDTPALQPVLHLSDVFDGLHKELGLPRGRRAVPFSSTVWCHSVTTQQADSTSLSPVLRGRADPKLWTAAQSVLYASSALLKSMESLSQLFYVFLEYSISFTLLLMLKADAIALITPLKASREGSQSISNTVLEGEQAAPSGPSQLPQIGSAYYSIDVAVQIEELVALPENAGYRSFVRDVFTSLPPSLLHAQQPEVAFKD